MNVIHASKENPFFFCHCLPSYLLFIKSWWQNIFTLTHPFLTHKSSPTNSQLKLSTLPSISYCWGFYKHNNPSDINCVVYDPQILSSNFILFSYWAKLNPWDIRLKWKLCGQRSDCYHCFSMGYEDISVFATISHFDILLLLSSIFNLPVSAGIFI